ncbi:MAG TPA: efflux RND transporter periplasmic adaptor subunit [Bryobacteraceae bacterium]|nr:efflux RND transporter periplasmic adaptor subunit [Bryobacteraceae bacterium]
MLPYLVLFLLLGFTFGCTGPYSTENVAAKEAPPIDVRVIPVTRESVPDVVTANGELFAEESTNITTKVPGRIAKMNVDLGSVVKQGDVLAELEKDDYEFRVQQTEALVEQIRARLGLLNKDSDDVKPEQVAIVREADAALREAKFILDTTTRLAKDGVVSRIEYEKANVRTQGIEARYQAAISEVMQLRSQLSERRAQLALARQQLEDATIRAPFSGAITRRAASVGEFLPVNALLVTLVRQNPLRVRLGVPERQAARIRHGQPVEVRLEGMAERFVGRVVRLSPAIDAQSRSLVIEGELPNPNGLLRPGSFVEGTIVVNGEALGISVPEEAVAAFAGINRTFLVKNGVLEDRVVKTGRSLSGGRIEILDGLAAGDQVVAKTSDRMAKGQKVRVR